MVHRGRFQPALPMKLRKHDLEILATSCAFSLVFYVGRNGPWTPKHIAGAVLLGIGFIGWLTARLQIREFFAVTAQAQGLVTTGIYSRIRNPIYFFGVVFFAGMALYLPLPRWVLLALLAIIFMQVLRAQRSPRPGSKIRRRLPPIPRQNLVLNHQSRLADHNEPLFHRGSKRGSGRGFLSGAIDPNLN